MLRRVNAERGAAGLPPLRHHAGLRKYARLRAREISVQFSHTRPGGKQWDDDLPIRVMAFGENIASGQRTPTRVMDAWMSSPGHRANILNGDFTEIGIACFHDPNARAGFPPYYWVQVFAVPAP
ncbi:MAG: CAP domain-containing protein [Saccharofermentanales bacterium]